VALYPIADHAAKAGLVAAEESGFRPAGRVYDWAARARLFIRDTDFKKGDTHVAYLWSLVFTVLLVGIGLVDDYRPLGWKEKFGGIAVASAIVIFGAHAVVNHLGSLENGSLVDLGLLSIPFTYFCILGVTNAINLIDGLNGLAGGIALLGFLFLGIAGIDSGNNLVAVTAFSFIGVLLAYLPFNFPKAQMFMGDSGSLFLGFSLAFLSIMLTQVSGSRVSPMYPVLVLLLPIYDTLRMLSIRSLKRRNPFRADKGHLHHLFVRRGISTSRTTVCLWFISAICGIIALPLMKQPISMALIAIGYGTLALSLLAKKLASRRRHRSQAGKTRFKLEQRSRIINFLLKLWF
jgi:UDP-GlcNAc:undecaprenyl-phosphate GlcNAc-1-phosphate transferase